MCNQSTVYVLRKSNTLLLLLFWLVAAGAKSGRGITSTHHYIIVIYEYHLPKHVCKVCVCVCAIRKRINWLILKQTKISPL